MASCVYDHLFLQSTETTTVVDQDVEVVIEENDSHISRLAKLLSTSPREWSEDGVYAWMHYVISQFNLDSKNVCFLCTYCI